MEPFLKRAMIALMQVQQIFAERLAAAGGEFKMPESVFKRRSG